MPIIKWEPISEIERFLDDRTVSLPRMGWDLAVDVYEEKGCVIAKMNLPAVNPDELDIALNEDVLVISGAREEEKKADEKDYYCKEIRRGSFMRTVQLPKSVDPSRTSADYADGVLTLKMPVIKSDRKKPVAIKVGKAGEDK